MFQMIFGSVYSPPIGVTASKIEGLYQNYYRILLKTLYAHPQINLVLFFSGALLNWIEKYHSEFFDVATEMVKRRQLEIIGGGYYAPMFNLISKQDCIGQIELLTTYLRKNWGYRPRGCWIAGQIWEPSMPSVLRSADMNYVFLNEYHFWKAGFEERDFFTPCITEDQGKTIVAFPFSHDVYQNFWHMTPDDIQEKIEQMDDGREDQIISLIHRMPQVEAELDAEGIKKHLEQVLNRFDKLSSNKTIKIFHPTDYLRKLQKRARGYFPATSFDEMQAYGSIHALEEYLHRKGMVTTGVGRTGYYFGNLFRQNIVRYMEVNFLYAKMQFVQSLTLQIRGDKYRRQSAREELWHGQSNTPFWHGEMGGVYINEYRKEVYAALIRAEKYTREVGIFAPSILVTDFDMDGLNEYLYQGNQINAYLHSLGGILFELDYLPSPWNYLDTMGRYPEVYHDAERAGQGYDNYPRRAFIDHFFTPELTLSEFNQMLFEDDGGLATQPYLLESTGAAIKKKLELRFSVEGVLPNEGRGCRIRLEKTYSFDRRSVKVAYRVINVDEIDLHTVFTPEINMSFVSNTVKHLRVYAIIHKQKKVEIGPSARETEEVEGILFEDLFNKVKIEVNIFPATVCWSLPLETEHLDRDHWRQIYQASSILPRWLLKLKPHEFYDCTIAIHLAPIKIR